MWLTAIPAMPDLRIYNTQFRHVFRYSQESPNIVQCAHGPEHPGDAMSATSQTNNPPLLIHPYLVTANVENFEPQVNLPVEPAPHVDLQPPPTVANNSQNIRCIFSGCSSSFTTIQNKGNISGFLELIRPTGASMFTQPYFEN
jgi:hypothetical protein